jgi:membrane protein YdbS with pleckstrin-like domain
MPKLSRLLNEDEEVLVDVRPHWWYLAGPVAVLVVVLAGAITALVESAPTWADWAAVAGLVLAAAWLLARYVRWASTRLVVTSSRIIHRTGVLARRGREIPLAALTDISYHQSLFERIIRSGDLLLESAGRDGHEVFPHLPRPARIQNQIARQVDRARGQNFYQPVGEQQVSGRQQGPGRQQGFGDQRGSGPVVYAPSPVPPPEPAGVPWSIPAQIEQLDDLRRRGIISRAEFQAKKADLLHRL